MPRTPPSTLYKTLHHTAHSFLSAQNPLTPGTNTPPAPNPLCTRNHLTSFGPSFLISTNPMLQGTKTPAQFVEHMKLMTPMLETWRVGVTRSVVDEYRREVSVWAKYYMTPNGAGSLESRTVEHEISWWMKMTGDGTLVERAVEYVDGSAAQRIQELVGEYKKSLGGA